MLLEFKAKNYKSFKNEMFFSMIPAPKQKGLDYSVLRKEINNKLYKGLSSSVIYGANASGKTSIIEAMDVYKSIILRGNIRNATPQNINAAADNLEMIPNVDNDKKEPIEFNIKFIEDNILFEYGISIDIGLYATKDLSREILSEKLFVDNNLIFDRNTKTIEFHKINFIEQYLIKNFKENEKSLREIAGSNINKEELFLVNGFKNIFSQILADRITNWLNKKFITIYMANTLLVSPQYDREKIQFFKSSPVNDIAKIMGSINDIGYVYAKEDSSSHMVSVLNKKKIFVPANIFESYGTFRFLNIVPILTLVLKKGGTLVVDEFDASLHPMVVMNIVKIFHNDEININKAQLIFNTHNPIFLNSNFFRRDEIKFVERNEQTHFSELYSLSDFGTDGKDGVRKGEDYMKNYFVNKYGAIRDIDFSSVFEKLIKAEVKSE